jgi:NADPH:quinone reductase-like Zn-dependent oxidoreductase
VTSAVWQTNLSHPESAHHGGPVKAIVQDRYGSPDVLSLTDVDRPLPAENELLVRIHAASVNAHDWHIMRGDPYLARLMLPAALGRRGPKHRIRGRDFAGQVVTVGAGVRGFKPGDEVYGDLGNADGAFAEYVCVPGNGAVEPKPANLSFEQAAALPLAAATALAGLRDLGQVQPGQQVLINGASGGVGTFAVQLSKALGAEVTGVCSTRNVDGVRSIGADHVLDYAQDDFTRQSRHFDVILDLVGNRSLTDCRRVLTPTGTLVLAGGGVWNGGNLIGPVGLIIRGQLLSRLVHHRLLVLSEAPGREHLATLRELCEAGKITPVIERTYPLREVPEAIRYLETEHARAKVVITV